MDYKNLAEMYKEELYSVCEEVEDVFGDSISVVRLDVALMIADDYISLINEILHQKRKEDNYG